MTEKLPPLSNEELERRLRQVFRDVPSLPAERKAAILAQVMERANAANLQDHMAESREPDTAL